MNASRAKNQQWHLVILKPETLTSSSAIAERPRELDEKPRDYKGVGQFEAKF